MTTVDWEQPGLMALSETDGHGDTCGEITILDDLALRFPGKYKLDIATLDVVRADCIQWKDASGGMTMYSIGQVFEQHYGVKPIKVVDWDANLNFQLFRHDLINALLLHQPVIMQTSQGHNLPNNQSGVLQHFIYIAGINTALGYLVCNGDTYAALAHGGAVKPSWVGVGFLQASVPDAYLILPAIEPVVSVPPVSTPPAVDYQAKYVKLHSDLSALVATD
jgi:hypothetical protein